MRLKTIIMQATVSEDYDATGLGDEFAQLIESRGAMATGVHGYAVHHDDEHEVDVTHAIYPSGVYR